MHQITFLSKVILFCLIAISYTHFSSIAQPHHTEAQDLSSFNQVEKDELDQAIEGLMQKYSIPGLSIAFMENGAPGSKRTYGLLQAGKDAHINDETVFSVGSVSKAINAILTLRLVHAGMLDLDKDVNHYLKSWKIEQGEFNKEQAVTLRHLLSHTAGLSVHGFADYYPDEKLPTTTQILRSEGPAKNSKVKLIFPVGTKFKYSGGGITVIQQIIEDVTGLPYHKAASKFLFQPLGLERSSYENPLPGAFGNIAKAHNSNGKPVALPRGYQAMPEAAASGLWSCPADLIKILSAVLKAQANTNSDFLSPQLVEDMISPEAQSEYGLGPRISFQDGNHIVSHGGSNESYKATFSIFWKKQRGYAIFTNGSRGTELIRELKPIIEKQLAINEE